MALASRCFGTGPPVVLIHGGLEDGAQAWPEQTILADRWTLHVPDRVGYGASAGLGSSEDFDRDAELLAPALPDGAHLVGHSSGALAAMFTAAHRPDAVASLALIEPPAFHLVPAARELAEAAEEIFDADVEPVVFLRRFFEVFAEGPPPDEVLESLAAPAEVWRGFVRRPWHVDLPLEEIASAPFPVLVFSGGYSAGFEAVCDTIAERTGAERAVLPGQGHEVQRTGAPFNDRLEAFWGRARTS
ncbi:MAG TPA: alpha/beta hydrolase [Solirubrobacteraceae bacterium]|jgi:pimeloyl-ACP methyl ester carboxylesterase